MPLLWYLFCRGHGILIGQRGELYLLAFHRLPCGLGWTAGRNEFIQELRFAVTPPSVFRARPL